MSVTIYDYLMHDGHNPFKEWTRSLGKPELAKLNQKLDMLERCGGDLPPGLLSDTNLPNIKKIRINGKVALRPLLCRGPINVHTEFTLLHGCIEKDRKLPKGSLDLAETRRNDIINDRHRRTKHERVGWKAA
jgi:phage-related protein